MFYYKKYCSIDVPSVPNTPCFVPTPRHLFQGVPGCSGEKGGYSVHCLAVPSVPAVLRRNGRE
jgi:hypothetical protein